MSSPFTIFRRHQRILMVVITGLSMISFVLLGAVQDPRQIPTPLIVVFLAALAGGMAWLAGLNSGKGTEWGLTGALVGAVIGIAGALYSREASAVLLDNGNLSSQQVYEIQRQRNVVNRFVVSAFQETFGIPLQALPGQVQASYLFGFFNADDIPMEDVAITELLRREADRIGIVISDKVVDDFIKQVTTKEGLTAVADQVRPLMSPQDQMIMNFYLAQMKEKKLSGKAFTRIRQAIGISESGLLNAIRNELKVRQAYKLLSGNNYFPPEQFWEFYQKLNVRQSAEVASVPVNDFIDLTATPSDADLTKLFEKYRENYPGFTPDGRPAPGQPGFFQSRRFQLGYLEANYDQLEPLAGEVSDEEIQKAYEEKYLKNVPAGTTLEGPDLPFLPSMEKPAMETPAEKPADAPVEKPGEMPAEKPADTKPEPAKSESDLPAPPEKPGQPAKPQPPAEPVAPAKPAEAPKGEAPMSEAPKPEEASKPEEAPKADEGMSLNMKLIGSRQVLFLQDEPAAPAAEAAKSDEKPAEEKKTDEKPADKPAETPTDKASEKPADPATPPPAPTSGTMGDAAIPPAPSSDPAVRPSNEPPPLDDALKAQLKSEILKERTKVEIEKRIEAAALKMSELSTNILRQKDEQGYMTLEDATKELELYAAQNQLTYVTTPPMTYQELATSEDYPIGQAQTLQRMVVADAVARSTPSDLYRVYTATDFVTSNSYVYWKLTDKPAYVPQTLDDDPGLRAAVTKAWNLEQARPKAKARAEALAKMVRESDQPMGTVLAEQTITGTTDSLFIPVRITGDFTWMQKPIVPQTGLQQAVPVQPSFVPGVDKAGDEFFTEVFDKLNVGDVGVAPNNDHDVYYVVKIESRDPSNPEQLEALRKKFLEEGTQAAGYPSMLQQFRQQNSVNWLEQLLKEHEFVNMARLTNP